MLLPREEQTRKPTEAQEPPGQVMLREVSVGTGAAANHHAADCNLGVSLHQKIRVETLKGEAVFWQPPNVQSISKAESIQAV